MDTSALVTIFGEGAARRIAAFQIRRIEKGCMAKLATLLGYLADNRSLRLLHTCEDEEVGILTAYLSGETPSLELLKFRVESVFPEFEVLWAPAVGPALREAA